MEFEFRALSRADFPVLGRWLGEPHVHRWWSHDNSPEAVEDDFRSAIDGDQPAQVYVVVLDGAPIGLIQFCMFADYPEYVAELVDVYPVGAGAGSIDYFIGDARHVGRGVGTTMIGAFTRRLWQQEPALTHLVVPVNSANVASWTALLRAGFGLVAQGELEPDNPIDDRMHEVLRLDRPG